MIERQNGAMEEAIRPKDYQYNVIAGNNIENNFPKQYQVKYLGAEVKDQGSISSCVACTMATILEAWYQKLFNKDKKFSEGWNYGKLRKDNWRGPGMSSSSALDYQTKIGTVPKSLYDLLIEMPDAADEVAKFPELDDDAFQYRFKSYLKLNCGDTRTGQKKDLEIKDALTKYNVPLFAIATKGFGTGNGVNHAICIVGWDDEKDRYLVKNSWGPTYGGKGTGIGSAPKDYFREVYLVMYDDIKLPFTDMTENDWFYKELKKAYMAGVIKGKSETIFDPLGGVTRAELGTVASRLLDKMDELAESINKMQNVKNERNK